MNDEIIIPSEETVNEDLSSSPTNEVVEEKPVETVSNDSYIELVTQVEYVNQHLQNLTNISVVSMVGISIVFGCVLALIFSHYIRG